MRVEFQVEEHWLDWRVQWCGSVLGSSASEVYESCLCFLEEGHELHECVAMGHEVAD